MKAIALSKGKVVIVDDEDFEYLNQWKWSYGSGGYAVREQHLGMQDGKKLRKTILMHRLITNAPRGMDVDHINDDKLDNQRSNLRVCTRSQNMANKKSKKRTHALPMGVCFTGNPRSNKPYTVRVGKDSKIHFVGNFYDVDTAHKAYLEKKKQLFGEYA